MCDTLFSKLIHKYIFVKRSVFAVITRDFKDIRLSALGMGNMRLPVVQGGGDGDIDLERGKEIIDRAMKNGVNYYDTAYIYHSGKSEGFLKEALVKRYPRDSFYIADKFFIQANPDYKAVFEEQLERLGTDYIDFYLIHSVGDNTSKMYIDSGCIEYFAEQKRIGRIKYLGFSFHASLETLKSFSAYREWDFAQIQLNYYDWLYGSSKAEYELLREKNIPIVVMEPVRGGKLAALGGEAEKLLKESAPDRSVASWAFCWLKRLDGIKVILSGMSNNEQMEDNLNTFADGYALSDDEEKVLFDACAKFKAQLTVPCTACRYCCDGCPAEIDIPAVLTVYNRYKVDGDWALDDIARLDSKGKPKDCVGCAACEGHCPQSIAISDIMSEIAAKGK